MPDTKSNQTAFPQKASQKAGLSFPICRLLAVSCLQTVVILNATLWPFKGKGSDEQSLLRQVLDTFQKGSIEVGDAFLVLTFYWLKSSKELKKRLQPFIRNAGTLKMILEILKPPWV
jgi:hypothetical protein